MSVMENNETESMMQQINVIVKLIFEANCALNNDDLICEIEMGLEDVLGQMNSDTITIIPGEVQILKIAEEAEIYDTEQLDYNYLLSKVYDCLNMADIISSSELSFVMSNLKAYGAANGFISS